MGNNVARHPRTDVDKIHASFLYRRRGAIAGLIPKGVSNLAMIPCVIGLGVSVSCFPRQSHRPCGSRLRHMLLIWDNFESACSLPDPNGAHPAA